MKKHIETLPVLGVRVNDSDENLAKNPVNPRPIGRGEVTKLLDISEGREVGCE